MCKRASVRSTHQGGAIKRWGGIFNPSSFDSDTKMFQLVMQIVKRAVLLGLGLTEICGSFMAAQVPSGFGTTPIFDEEFNGTSLNTTIWTYRGEGTVKHDCYIDSSAVAVANGHLRIHIYTTKNPQGVQTNYCGAITTQSGTLLHTYGYWEVSVRYQYRPGMHCGFWVDSPLIRSPLINNPQQSGTEMDVFEHIESAGPTEYDHAVWWNGYGAYSTGTSHVGTQSNLDDGHFHTFGLAWTPGTLTFYVDGVQTWHLSPSDVAISNIPEYIILDTELTSASGIPSGGYGPLGSPSNPYMEVDYVRVYPYSTKTTSTTLSPIADAYVQDGVTATTNFSGSPTLLVKNGAAGNKQNSYLKFDLSNIAAPVLQATLYLTPTAMSSDKTVNVANYVSDNSWTASGITWNNQPPIIARLSSGINYAAGILTNFDVTAIATAGKQFSVQIAGDTSSGGPVSIAYGAEENGTISYRPQLVVISGYNPVKELPSVLQQRNVNDHAAH
jgi:endo-1,3-1,4-beta-glycanase ExoK